MAYFNNKLREFVEYQQQTGAIPAGRGGINIPTVTSEQLTGAKESLDNDKEALRERFRRSHDATLRALPDGTMEEVIGPTDVGHIATETDLEELIDEREDAFRFNLKIPSTKVEPMILKEVAKVLVQGGREPSWQNVYQFLADDENLTEFQELFRYYENYDLQALLLLQEDQGRMLSEAPSDVVFDDPVWPPLLSSQDMDDLTNTETVGALVDAESFVPLSEESLDDEMNAELAREFPQTAMGSLPR